MARGFESKDVEYQQAERERARNPDAQPQALPADSRKVTLELSLARMRADREKARIGAHRAMIDQAIATLEAELASLSSR
jgi:hypothetical protein